MPRPQVSPRAPTIALALLLASCPAPPIRADLVGISWFNDTNVGAVAAVTGDLRPNSDPRWTILAEIRLLSLSSTSPNSNWSLDLIFRYTPASGRLTINVIDGKHISNPPPHDDETSPGPTLRIGPSAFPDLTGEGGAQVDPLIKETWAPHLISEHADRMIAQVFDNDPNSNSVLSGGLNNLGMTVTFSHVPEPGPMALGCCLIGLAAARAGWARRTG